MAQVVEMIDQARSAKTSPQSLSLVYSPRRRPKAALERMLAFVNADTPNVGPGSPVQLLEHRIAELLAKPAALLLPTGKMAQQIALRIHCERSGRPIFAAHPTCHVLNWEYDGYAVVHGLRCSRLGDAYRLFGTADIVSIPEPPGAVVWELPQRELGGELPSWTELQDQIALARGRGAAIHLDGARLWETQPAYDRPLDQIAALFDSVYVSLYKTLEVPRGAVLAGDAGFIAEARIWSVRLGGESVGNWPLGVAGLLALDEILPRPRHPPPSRMRLTRASSPSGEPGHLPPGASARVSASAKSARRSVFGSAAAQRHDWSPGHASRRRRTQKMMPIRTAASTTKMPVSMDWKAQKRLAG